MPLPTTTQDFFSKLDRARNPRTVRGQLPDDFVTSKITLKKPGIAASSVTSENGFSDTTKFHQSVETVPKINTESHAQQQNSNTTKGKQPEITFNGDCSRKEFILEDCTNNVVVPVLRQGSASETTLSENHKKSNIRRKMFNCADKDSENMMINSDKENNKESLKKLKESKTLSTFSNEKLGNRMACTVKELKNTITISYDTQNSGETTNHNENALQSNTCSGQIKMEDKVLCCSEQATNADPKAKYVLAKDRSLSPFERFRSKKNSLCVTDFAVLSWCEQQVEYYLADGGRKQTEAMAKGSEIHLDLEMEDHEIIEIELITQEDKWGDRFLKTLVALESLLLTGKTREMPIYGFVSQYFVYGIIDDIERREIQLTKSQENSEQKTKRLKLKQEPQKELSKICPLNQIFTSNLPTTMYTYVLSDTKTRAKPFLPNPQYQSGSKYQLMLYKRMFDEFALRGINEERVYKTIRIDPDVPFSKTFGSYVHTELTKLDARNIFCDNIKDDTLNALMSNENGSKTKNGEKQKLPHDEQSQEDDGHPENTVRTLMQRIKRHFSLFTKSSNELELSYLYQGDKRIIGTTKFTYDAIQLQKYLKRACDFWKGARTPEGVEIEEAWKCRMCDYIDTCEWRAKKAKELAEKHQMLSNKSKDTHEMNKLASIQSKLKDVTNNPQSKWSISSLATSKEFEKKAPKIQKIGLNSSLMVYWTDSNKKSSYNYIWLRDNCQCSKCIHPDSKQKLHSSAQIPLDIRPVSAIVKSSSTTIIKNDHDDTDTIEIIWDKPLIKNLTTITGSERSKDQEKISGNSIDQSLHKSVYTLEFLHSYSTKKAINVKRFDHFEPILWDRDTIQKANLWNSYKDYITNDKILLIALKQLSAYGLMFLHGAPTEDDDKGIVKVIERIGNVRNTIYGKTWDVKLMPNAKNIAYTNLDLGLHMDLLYYDEPPGLQLLLCLKNSVKGGKSIFADSLKAIAQFRDQYPEDYEILKETPINFSYTNDGHDMHFNRPAIIVDEYNNTMMVNYSPPFQGPIEANIGSETLTTDESRMKRFYCAFQRFSSFIEAPELKYELALKPGELIVFANRRVLHGRRAFDGLNAIKIITKKGYLYVPSLAPSKKEDLGQQKRLDFQFMQYRLRLFKYSNKI
ncbi:hypothetical protein G9A89_000837 [Geosiphon pyriformis]|nr:hypothetical protein G9A89_000837 [Geosiphon pyriformis]